MDTARFDLTGKVVWITGAGRGLGRSIAEGLSAAGARVAVTARTAEDVDALAHELRRSGGDALSFPGSVADEQDVRRIAAEILDSSNRLDVLVNCAGISPVLKRSESLTVDEWRSIVDVNLTGLFLCCRESGRVMLDQGEGSIINISSVYGHVGAPRMAAYSASKGGVELLSKALAVEWADRNVRVNALAPGYFTVGVSEPLLASRWRKNILDRIPSGRFGDPGELVGAAAFLASDQSSYITGSTITVDGGWTAQ